MFSIAEKREDYNEIFYNAKRSYSGKKATKKELSIVTSR